MKTADTPEEWYEIFKDAISAKDIDQAAALFDDAAVFVVQPGTLVSGDAAVREGLGGFIAMGAELQFPQIGTLVAYGICFALATWSMLGTDPGGNPVELEGESTDVLRQQHDRSWRILVDNAYGVV